MTSRLRSPRVGYAAWAACGVGVALVVLARVAAVAQRRDAAPRASSFEERVWDFPSTPAGPLRAVALVPRGLRPGDRLPLLVALHGRGEAQRGVERGAHGWGRDYELGASDLALRRGRLTPDDFLGHVTPDRLRALRASLARRPYRGLVVVAPYTPDVLGDVGGALHAAYDAWLAGPLLARARAELPVLATRDATGIDGVSLGGLHALWTGLAHPEAFGAVGALQPAVRGRADLVAARYPAGAPRAPRVRLVTSDGDYFRRDVRVLGDALAARGLPAETRVLAGPHDYAFNRGPGGIEMLLFHDRALRGDATP